MFRAFNICSDYLSLHREIEYLVRFFHQNSFPQNLVYKHIRIFLDSKLNPKPPAPTVKKQVKYICMPYFGYISEKIKKDLQRIFSKYYPQVDIRLAFTNKFSIG